MKLFFSYLGIDNREDWIPFFAKWFFLGLVIHVIVAIFSKGFYHFDEHYQILEFLSTKIHGDSVKDLALKSITYNFSTNFFS